MGANQSRSDGSGQHPVVSQSAKTCYYELLGVDRQATDEEIKKAYRKKALELHPDRNFGNVEETTNLFAEVQSAYAVLSDPQERAWYDSHRNAILQGDQDRQGDHYEYNVRITTTEDILKLLPKINACRDFSDSALGFYSVLREVFDTLAEEERLACTWENMEPVDYTSFGHAGDDYDTHVRFFYTAWASFATSKTFSWTDVYRCSEAPDRRVRRLMEKENKRLRDEAIREFNDAVRSLVAFVKKRDPRYKPSSQSEAERQRVLRDAASAQAARSRAVNRAREEDHITLPRWTQPEEPGQSEHSTSAEEDEAYEVFECVICDKSFKSEKQFEAHEKSKKHLKATQRLRKQMRDDAKDLGLEGPPDRNPNAVPSVELSPSRAADQTRIDTPSVVDSMGTHVESLLARDPAGDRSTDTLHKFTSGASVTESHSRASSQPTFSDTSDDEYASREEVEARVLGHHTYLGNNPQSTEDPHSPMGQQDLDRNRTESSHTEPKVGKAKAKRAKKAAQKSAVSASADAQVCPFRNGDDNYYANGQSSSDALPAWQGFLPNRGYSTTSKTSVMHSLSRRTQKEAKAVRGRFKIPRGFALLKFRMAMAFARKDSGF
ncbi:MAG: hypothetical protein Q9222_004053 [Ikaeria aurantiellina]